MEQSSSQGIGRTWSRAIHQRDFGVILDWFTNYFFIFGGVALLVAGLAAWADEGGGAGLRVLGLGLLFAVACTASGWVLGLLFGIPRSLARPQPVAPAAGGPRGSTAPIPSGAAAAPAPTSRANTNLEDNSDWLTKTIVGVGLTQLFSVPHFLWSKAEQLNTGGFGWTPHGQLLALALFLYFAPGGFWLGYVGTRTLLTRLFDVFDRPDAESVSEAADPQNLRLGPSDTIVRAENGVASADRDMLRLPLQALSTAREIAAWGAAQARAGNLVAAQTAFEEARRDEPTNPDFKQQLATLYTALGLRDEAARLAEQVPNTEIALHYALYERPPQGFLKAIAIGEELVKQPGQEKNAMLHVWVACAYGQQHAYEKSRAAAANILQSIKDKVVREISAAIAADPRTRDLLRSLWKPTPGAEDRDLESFEPNDPDLSRLLDPG